MHQIRKNIFTILLLSPLALIINFLITPLLIDLFGLNNYGIFALIINLISFSSIMNLGLGVAGARFLSKQVTNNKDIFSKIISNNLFVSVIIALFFSILFFSVFNFIIENFYNLNSYEKSNIIQVRSIIVATIFLKIVLISFRGYLVGFNRLNIAKINEFILIFLSLTLTYITLRLGSNFSQIFLIRLMPIIFYLLFVYFYLKANSFFSGRLILLDRKDYFDQLKYGIKSFININSPYIKEIPLLFLGTFSGPLSVGLYAPFKLLINAINNLLINLLENIFPITSRKSFVSEKSKENFFNNIYYKILLFSFGLHFLFLLLAKPLIQIWLGESFSSQIFILHILSIGSFGYSVSSALFYFSQGLGKPEVGRNFGILLTILQSLLAIVLIKKLNILGAGLSFTLAIVLTDIYLIKYFGRHILNNVSPHRDFVRTFYFILGCLLLSLVVIILNT